MMQRVTRLLALVAAVAVGVVACEPMSSTGPTDETDGPEVQDGTTTLKVLLTDAPADYVGAAWVDIGAVQLVPAGEDGPIITLTEDGTDGMVNLLELEGEATAQLADTTIEPGTYSQLRLIVDSARVDLIEGYTFRDGSTSMSLKVPSGAQTGIKLNLWGANGDGTMGDMDDDTDDMDDMEDGSGVVIHPGETVLVLDFDVNQSFRIQGNPETPAGIKSMLFKPTLRVTVQDVAGSISGTVTGPDTLDLDGLMVTAEPTGDGIVEGYQTRTATAMTDSAGDYTLYYLVPGEYEVSVEAPEGYYAAPAVQTVMVGEDEDVMGIDFALEEAGSIAGTVTGAADSIPVAELTVTAEDTTSGTVLTAETDSEGAYTIDGVLAGEYLVTVGVAEGYITTPDTATVTVGAGEDVTGVDFTVDDVAGSIAGTVTAADDSISVAELTVTAEDTAADHSVTAETDDEGNYIMPYVVPGEYLVTVGVAEGFATDPATAEVTVGVNEAVEDVDFTIDEAEGDG